MSSSEYVTKAEYDELVKKHEALLTKSFSEHQSLSNALHKLEGQNALLRESNFVLVNTYDSQLEKLNKKVAENESTIETLQQELQTQLQSNANQTGDGSQLALYDQLVAARRQVSQLHTKVNELEVLQTKNRADVVTYKNVIIELQDRLTKLSQQQKSSLITEDLLTLVKLQLQIDMQSAAATAAASSATASVETPEGFVHEEKASGGGSSGVHDGLITSILNERNLLRATKNELQQELADLRSHLSLLSQRVGAANQSIPDSNTASQAQITQLKTELQSAQQKITALSSEIVHLHQRLRDSSTGGTGGVNSTQDLSNALNDITQLHTSLEKYRQQHEEDEDTITKLHDQVERLTLTFDEYKQAAATRFQQLTQKYKSLFDEAGKLQQTVVELRRQHAREVSTLHNKFIAARTQSNRQRILQLTRMKDQVDALRAEINSVKSVVTSSTTDTAGLTKAIVHRITSQNAAQAQTLAFIKERYEQEVKLRKRVFNQLQELKGNIRVYARVRPLNDIEREDRSNHNIVTVPREGEIRVTTEVNGKRTPTSFEFEHVFDPLTTQETVFEEVKDLVTSVMDGYNVCIFAYGQTGSGKTYTMEGYGNAPGVNPRALDLLFTLATSNAEWKWSVKLTLIEIYNERVQDLLREDDSNLNLRIVQGKDGMEIPGCNIVTVTSADEVQQFLAKGKKNRHVTRTDMNEHSSRSHLILSVFVTGHNKLTGVTVNGRLNLIDLAGSERISRSGVTGEALKEAQKINYSLSALGNVISARANKKDHIPYRDSALTYLLQDSLDKNSKTLMIVQLSPTMDSAPETICSLRFAERVRKVELGKASRNQQIQPRGDE